jgi:hypothetical protein
MSEVTPGDLLGHDGPTKALLAVQLETGEIVWLVGLIRGVQVESRWSGDLTVSVELVGQQGWQWGAPRERWWETPGALSGDQTAALPRPEVRRLGDGR